MPTSRGRKRRRVAGVQRRIHAGRQHKKAGKSGPKERDRGAKFRLLACRDRKKGHGIREISRDLQTSYLTVRDWLVRMRERGLKGRFNRRPKGQEKVPAFPS